MATDAWACRDRDELKNDLCRYVTSKCQEETKRRTKKWGRNPRPRAGTLPRRDRGTVYNSCRAEGYRRTKDGRGLVWWRIAGEWWLKKIYRSERGDRWEDWYSLCEFFLLPPDMTLTERWRHGIGILPPPFPRSLLSCQFLSVYHFLHLYPTHNLRF